MAVDEQTVLELTLRVEGLTQAEIGSLSSHLSEQTGCQVTFPRRRPHGTGVQPGQIDSISASALATISTIAISYGAAHLIPVGREFLKAFSKKMGEATGDIVSDWFKERFQGKSSVEAQVTLYGPDDKPIENLKGRR